jgi:hypothetical protein
MRHGDETVQAMEWAYQEIRAIPGLSDALGVGPTGLDSRVWSEVAPADTGSPWIVFQVTDAEDANALGGQPRIFSSVPIQVKAVGEARHWQQIAAVARLLYDNLHGQTNVPIGNGGTILTVQRTGPIQYPEQAGGIEYRHLGHQFQVEVQ